jgi:hypothetical protein
MKLPVQSEVSMGRQAEPVASYASPIEDPAQFDLQETLKQMPAGQTLYRIFAMDKPI